MKMNIQRVLDINNINIKKLYTTHVWFLILSLTLYLNFNQQSSLCFIFRKVYQMLYHKLFILIHTKYSHEIHINLSAILQKTSKMMILYVSIFITTNMVDDNHTCYFIYRTQIFLQIKFNSYIYFQLVYTKPSKFNYNWLDLKLHYKQ